nr:hypothetical protein [Lachnospiraceae bacterium]
VLLAYALIRYLIWLTSMMAAWNKGDHSVRISYHYKKLTTLMIRKNIISRDQKFLLPTDFASVWTAYMKAKSAATADMVTMPFNTETTGLQPDKYIAEMSDLLLACLFSDKGIEKSQAQTLLTFLKQCRTQLH